MAAPAWAQNPLDLQPERPLTSIYEGPIIDVHNHPKGLEMYQEHLAQAEASGIVHTILMGTPNEFRKRNSRHYQGLIQTADKASALCSPDFVGIAGINRDPKAAHQRLQNSFDDFKAGKCRGFGEVGLSHYDKPVKRPDKQDKQQHIVQLPLDHELVESLFAFAHDNAAPVTLHIEPFYSPRSIDRIDEVIAFYKDACERYPNAKFIAAHNGMMPPEQLEDIFKACPNVYADVKFTHSKSLYWGFSDLHIVSDLDYLFHERWAQAIERFPDRYMYGSDWKMGKSKSFADFAGHIRQVRWMVGSLKPDVQRPFMYENAIRVFGLDP